MPTRRRPWKLLCEYTQSESLRKHMLAVETCVRAYAKKNSADEETWSIAALLHDFDYEKFPNNEHAADKEHPAEGARILKGLGYSDEIIRAILSHADYSGVARQSPLEHTLFACDELWLSRRVHVRPPVKKHFGFGSRFREKANEGQSDSPRGVSRTVLATARKSWHSPRRSHQILPRSHARKL